MRIKLGILTTLLSMSGHSQEPIPVNATIHPRAAMLGDNTRKLTCTLRLDREVYLAGETATAYATLTNPTHELLEVYDPLVHGGLNLLRLATKRELQEPGLPAGPYRYVSPHPNEGWRGRFVWSEALAAELKSVWLKPGEARTLEIRSIDPWPGTEHSSWGSGGGVPTTSGEYQLWFNYCWDARAAFRVIQPVFRSLAAIRLNEPLQLYDSTVRGVVESPRYLYALELQIDGTSIIVARQRDSLLDHAVREAPGQVFREGAIGVFSPFHRVAEVKGPVANLGIRRVDEATFEVVWTETGGRLARRSYQPRLTKNTLRPE